MSRTPFFAAIQKALARSARDAGIILPQSSALTRRRLLRLSAAAAGAAALSPVFKWSAYAKEEAPRSIAIIGGGVAGLTAAYRLQAAGVKPVVFEASNRWGGRIFTQYDFYKGMFCELGGEFVDTNHEDLQKLGSRTRRGDAEARHRRRGRRSLFFQWRIPHAEGHARPGKADGRLRADRQADRRRRREAYRQGGELDGICRASSTR